ncbi:helix-turn-helix domain-containing protein [Streptomyces sp. NPDC126514]|uniref:helix-turn-helix domain-containing protein n=1 Tax=Streptomyces sp. NPDC126514 TaxID=3155210 RepID=UPI003329BBE3
MSTKQKSVTEVDPWAKWERSPWEARTENAETRQEKSAEEESATPSPEELEEILAEVYRPEAEQTQEVPEAVTNDSWEDMTHRNKWEWLDRIETGYNLTNNAFRVAHALAGFGGSNNTKGIFPNHKTLAAKTEQSVGNVKKGLTELETKDLIRKAGGGRGHAVRYAIGVPA